MNVLDFRNLILTLPVRQQCFSTKRDTWVGAEREFEWLRLLNNDLFRNNHILQISRDDIFTTKSTKEKILKIIYWGYSSGMRGKNFNFLLSDYRKIEAICDGFMQNRNLGEGDYEDIIKELKQVKGAGFSTYSKLLYFFELTFNGYPSLILDQRVNSIILNNKFDDFKIYNNTKYNNCEAYYIKYLKNMHKISLEIGCSADKVELFLFMFGNNLKF